MTGRRRAHWRDGNDIPQGGMVYNQPDDYVESFEDTAIARMDRKDTIGAAIKSLPPSQQRIFVRDMLGYKCESPAERMSLSRARRSVAKQLEKLL